LTSQDRTLPLVPIDALPGFGTPPPNQGCHLAPSCLRCPFPVCRLEDSTLIKPIQDRDLRECIEAEGLTVNEAAAKFNITARTIFTENCETLKNRGTDSWP